MHNALNTDMSTPFKAIHSILNLDANCDSIRNSENLFFLKCVGIGNLESYKIDMVSIQSARELQKLDT